MPIFLDTSNVDQITRYNKMGIIRGVTTNPSIINKEISGSDNVNLKNYFTEIAKLIDPLPLSLEVTTNDFNEMLDQSLELSSWGKNINVKITIHGPNGELDNIEVINLLENKHNIRVNVTAMMNSQQCLRGKF